MRAIVAIIASLTIAFAGQAGYCQQDQHHPATQQGSSQMQNAPESGASSTPGQMGAGPGGGMGDMMGMCMMMHPSIAVGPDAIYIVRGDQVLKLNKDTLQVIATGTLPPAPSMSGMSERSAAGRGPMMPSRPEMEQMMQQMRQMQPSQFEQSFLSNMIRHHQGAIDMSKLALTKATHPELQSFAQKTITNQGREQEQFAGWLKSWYNAAATRQSTPLDIQMTSDLSQLNGRDFEIRFMQDMIAHHSEAVQMGRDAEQKAVHQEVKAAARKIVNQQSAEIAQLTRWLSAWYGINASRS